MLQSVLKVRQVLMFPKCKGPRQKLIVGVFKYNNTNVKYLIYYECNGIKRC
jgi:hypothetical protein